MGKKSKRFKNEDALGVSIAAFEARRLEQRFCVSPEHGRRCLK